MQHRNSKVIIRVSDKPLDFVEDKFIEIYEQVVSVILPCVLSTLIITFPRIYSLVGPGVNCYEHK